MLLRLISQVFSRVMSGTEFCRRTYHLLVDTEEHLLVVVVHAANGHDWAGGAPDAGGLPRACSWIWANPGHTGTLR